TRRSSDLGARWVMGREGLLDAAHVLNGVRDVQPQMGIDLPRVVVMAGAILRPLPRRGFPRGGLVVALTGARGQAAAQFYRHQVRPPRAREEAGHPRFQAQAVVD